MLNVRKYVYLILLLSVSVAGSTRKEVVSKITDVRIYSERALVTRTANFELLTGSYTFIFPNLPANLSDESIKIKSSAGMRLGEVKVEKVFLEEEQEPKIAEINKEMEKLQSDSSAVEDALTVLNSKEKFLESIQVAGSTGISKELGSAKISPSVWREGLEFLVSEFTLTKDKIRDKTKEMERITNKLSALRKKLNTLKSMVALEKKNILVEAEVTEAGVYSIELSYILPGVSWAPYYEVRTLPKKEEVEISYYGKISQITGEEWENVNLALSTAQPIIGAQAPPITPWYVSVAVPGKVLAKRVRARAGVEEMAIMVAPPAAEYEVSTPVEAGVSTVFEIKGKRTIPSAGEPTNILIMCKSFSPKLKYVTIPKMAELAYLQSKIKNATDYLFLAGEISVFVGGDYVGKSMVKNVAPNEEFELSLGVDDRIKVKRELVKKIKGEAGILTRSERVEYLYKITIKNYKDTDIDIIVKDQLPVSQDESIKIDETELKPKPSKKEPNGIIEWELTLKPQEEKEIKLGFTIEYPQGTEVIGL